MSFSRGLSGFFSLSLAFTLVTFNNVDAATLEFENSDVLVNRGSGFVRANNGMQLKVGDLVMAKTGTARIAYTAICFNTVATGGVYRVLDESRCVASTADPAISPTNLIIGGLVAGGVTAAIILATSGSSSP